jgi:hypothetical protein
MALFDDLAILIYHSSRIQVARPPSPGVRLPPVQAALRDRQFLAAQIQPL